MSRTNQVMEIGRISWSQPGWLTPSPPPAVEDAKVLIFSDIDDTFVPWKTYNKVADTGPIERTRETLQNYEGMTVNGLCSARGLDSIKALSQYLKGAPLAFIGTNGGQQVYVNHENQPTEQWLAGLNMTDRDYQWDREVIERSGGFTTRKVQHELREVLSDFGFEKAALRLPKPHDKRDVYIAPLSGRSDDLAVIALNPDQTTFMIRANPRDLSAPLTSKHRALAQRIGQALETRLNDQGIEMESKKFISDEVHQIYLLEPKNVNKQALLEHLLGRYPSVNAIITAGDHVNDTQLAPPTYNGIDNFRIVSGNRPEMRMFIGQDNVAQVKKGELGPAIQSHLAHLLPEEEAV